MQADGVGYVRIAAFGKRAADQVRTQVAALTKTGATKLIIDVRNSAAGDLADGVAVARLFVPAGTLAIRESKAAGPGKMLAAKGDGAVTLPVTVLVDSGTSGPAEIFAAALSENKRAETDRRTHDRPRGHAGADQAARRQRPLDHHVALPGPRRQSRFRARDWKPDVPVDQPEGDFGAPQSTDPILQKALDRLSAKESGMNKQDLIAKIASDTGATKTSAAAAVESLLDGITAR